MLFVGVLLLDQILGGSDEIVENILFFVEHSGAVPRLSELSSPPQVGNGIHPAAFQPCKAVAAKLWRIADIEPAIAGELGRILAIELQALFVEDEHRNAGSVL